ncbi:MAG TPA: hypothetical protein VN924_14215 [Bryobacteraceae bacterium]|nr:hypothetical protein [Bryobacteraceae bacterium]
MLDVMSLSELAEEYGVKHPWMLRGESSPDIAIPTSTATADTHKVEDYVGRGSNSKLVNDLAKNSPDLYRALRGQAVAKGLIVA